METILKGKEHDNACDKVAYIAATKYFEIQKESPGLLKDELGELTPFSIGFIMGLLAGAKD